MSLTRLTCPECDTVMRPKVPVAPGKKVKCPKCENVFVAKEDVEEVESVDEVEEAEEARPKKKARAGAKARPEKAEKAPAKKKSEDEEVYGYIKEDEEEEAEKKPKINYAPDESIRDLRGPAIVKLRAPATWLTFTGLIGAVGWLVLIVCLIIPKAFPVDEYKMGTDKFGRPIKEDDDKKKKKGPPSKPFFLLWHTFEIHKLLDDSVNGAAFAGIMLLLLVFGAGYAGVTAFGSIKLLNLESREWGIASGIMGLLPIGPAGLIIIVSLFIQWCLKQIELDDGFDVYVTVLLGSIAYLAQVGVAIWTLIVANDQEVKDGYEYKPE